MQNSLYRPSATSDHLGRYYTASWISEQLIKQINIQNPKLIMELGAGAGSLSQAAHARWKRAELITVDLDSRIFETLKLSDPSIMHRHHIHDVLDHELDRKIDLSYSSVDVAICNPPYIRPRWRSGFAQILEAAGLTGSLKSLYDAGADLLFIAQNLRFLKTGGRLGVILPDGLIAGERFSGIRKNLIQNQTIKSVVQLPKRVFSKTEAQTYLVILEKTRNKCDYIELYNFDSPSDLSDPILIDQNEAIFRLDYRHHKYGQSRVVSKRPIKIADHCDSLIRGGISSAEIASLNYPVFHLTNFSSDFYGKEVDIPEPLALKDSHKNNMPPLAKIALPGDILMARVGRGLEIKVCMIKSGSCIISDCIFALRINKNSRNKIFKYLTSENGRDTLVSLSRGVGAAHISKSDVLGIAI